MWRSIQIHFVHAFMNEDLAKYLIWRIGISIVQGVKNSMFTVNVENFNKIDRN